MAEERWRDRIVEVTRMRIGDILPHPHNPRTHGANQLDPLRGHLGETGKTRIPMAYYSERNGGRLTFHDGHGRQALNPDEMWHIGITNLTDAEADLDIAVGDPIGALAGMGAAALDDLLREVSTGDAALQALIDQVAQDAGVVSEVAAEGDPADPANLWQGMPEFEHEDKTAFQSITLHFKDQEAVDAFADLVGQKITPKTRYLWYPEIEIETYADKRYDPEP